jgi:hypothetical protein
MSPFERVGQRLAGVRPGVALLLLCALQLALHARWLSLPPAGFHAWRQTQVLSVARNYHEESMNFFEPRVDSRGPWSGITGLEFPLPYWLMAAGYRAVGVRPEVARLVMLLFSFVAIAGAYRFGRACFGSTGFGLAAAAMLVTNPLFGYYSFVAGPDVPMLGFLLLALASLLEWSRAPEGPPPLRGVAALALAGLLKLSSAAAWPAVALLLARGLRGGEPRRLRGSIVRLGAGLLAVLAWYAWARHLSDVHHNHDFLLATKLPYDPAIVPGIARKVLLQWLPEMYVSYPQFALALLGAFSLRRAAAPGLGAFAIAFTAGLVAYGAAELPMLEMHDYFMMPVVALLLVLVLAGLHRLAAAAPGHPAARVALAALLLASAVVGPWRALSRFARAHPRADLAAVEARLPALAPDRTQLVIVASDPSPSIDLYGIHRKGWSVTADVEPDSLRSMIAQGARWLVSDSRALEERPAVRPLIDSVGSVGAFRVFRLAGASGAAGR